MDEQQYIKGFNQGYELMQQNPELATSIAKSLEGKENPLAMGIIDGGKEFLSESKEKDRFLGMHQNYKVSERTVKEDKDAQKEKTKEKENFERD